MTTDHDPQPRAILDDPWFTDALLGEIRDLTRVLYPEARIPETAMPRMVELPLQSENVAAARKIIAEAESFFEAAQRLVPWPDTPNVHTHERVAAALAAVAKMGLAP